MVAHGTTSRRTRTLPRSAKGPLPVVAHRYRFSRVTDYGSPGFVDDCVGKIAWAYDDLGRIASVTGHDAASGGNVVNQVVFAYDGWGNVTSSKQEHDGEVDANTPQVQHTYADGASGGEALYIARIEGLLRNVNDPCDYW